MNCFWDHEAVTASMSNPTVEFIDVVIQHALGDWVVPELRGIKVRECNIHRCR